MRKKISIFVSDHLSSKMSLQREAYEENAYRYQLHCVRVIPARKLGKRCKLDKCNAYVLYVLWICLKITEKLRQMQALVSYMYVS